MLFRQCAARKKLFSYVLGDPITRQGVIIDPTADLVAQARSFLAERKIALQYVLLTHFPDPTLEDTLNQLRSFGPRVAAHESTEYQNVDVRLRDNDIVHFGEETIRVIHTPGQMPCAVTYWWADRLFTGETLLATGPGSCGQGGNIAQQWRSIREKLLIFPDEYLIFPGRESRKRRVACVAEFRLAFGNQSGVTAPAVHEYSAQTQSDHAGQSDKTTNSSSSEMAGA
ncbi:MAG: MBL fold metallo-hydrolase [Acidithiobacillus ferrivorans]